MKPNILEAICNKCMVKRTVTFFTAAAMRLVCPHCFKKMRLIV